MSRDPLILAGGNPTEVEDAYINLFKAFDDPQCLLVRKRFKTLTLPDSVDGKFAPLVHIPSLFEREAMSCSGFSIVHKFG